MDVVDIQVKAIQSDIRKRAGKKFLYSTIHIYYCKCDQALNIQRLDQMGSVHLLLDEMGLDQMGLDQMGLDTYVWTQVPAELCGYLGKTWLCRI